MGGGRSGLYQKTQGAKNTVNTFIDNFSYANVTSPSYDGVRQIGFAGQDESGIGVGRSEIIDRAKKIVDVVAALIWSGDKFLICQRPANRVRGLYWEFVGGKVENGRTKEEELVRSCKEALDIIVKPNGKFATLNYVYSNTIIELTVFNCRISSGEPKLLRHNALAWITSHDIDSYVFSPTDKEILEKIKHKN